MASPTDAANESSLWQNLGLEQDLLLQIFERIGSTQTIKLTRVSSGWRRIITTLPGSWDHLEINALQSQSDSFEAWASSFGNSVRHLKVFPTIPPTRNLEAHFLQSMTGLQSYVDVAGITVDKLRNLPASLKSLEAKFVNPAIGRHSCQVLLGALIHMTKLSLDCQQMGGATTVNLSLPDANILEGLMLSSYGFSAVSYCLRPSRSLQTLRTVHLSYISTQEQLGQLMIMTALEELNFGIDTSRSEQSDSIDLAGINSLVSLKRLVLSLHVCYLRNAHMLQRLPQLQRLNIHMSEDVAVLFRPEDGSAFALCCLLDNLQHVELLMHSVFDVTDCLEGLQLVARIPSLTVILHQSPSRGPSEVHWAIKEGSVLARALQLTNLHVQCTSMLINLLPPSLESLRIVAKKINVRSDLRTALDRLDSCHLQARGDVEYF